MAQFEKYFTAEEATRMLPLVKKIVSDILRTGQLIQAIQAGEDAGAESLESCVERMNNLMSELSELGCQFKDWNFEIGLVDFPAIIDNREVFLCWRSDEDGIQYYHGINDGFVGRQRIPARYLTE